MVNHLVRLEDVLRELDDAYLIAPAADYESTEEAQEALLNILIRCLKEIPVVAEEVVGSDRTV